MTTAAGAVLTYIIDTSTSSMLEEHIHFPDSPAHDVWTTVVATGYTDQPGS